MNTGHVAAGDAFTADRPLHDDSVRERLADACPVPIPHAFPEQLNDP
ncbi:hypothetical protein SAMN05192584_11746 [Streptomyces pini]|uniref:Uncharacterized protein n=1 Tax=Streptomyces pini TaxID=1520580 RepID=A0A1I4GXE1_9ACTN|nr:hypothetical protein SAMN05192584_11746 [Streptomyces pini]